MSKKTTEQLSLLAFGDMDVATRSVFSVNDKKDEAGNLLASNFGLLKSKDIATALGLDPKDDKATIEAKILEGKDKLLAKMAQLVVKATTDEFWTAGGLRVVYSKRGKSGKLSKAKVIMSLEEARRPSGPSDEEIAAAMHMTVEQVAEMRARQEAKLREQHVDVESSTVPPKTDAEIEAELEAEQKALTSGVGA